MSRSLIPNSTQIPDVILDEWMAELEGAELKVVLYVARRTFGFGKRSDTISIPQMVGGITTADGEILDKGTGLSTRAAQEACNYLVDCGILLRKRSERPNAPSAFAINLRWDGVLLDRAKWRKGTKNAETAPQPLHPATVAPCNEQHPHPATIAPSVERTTPQPLHPQETERDSIQETGGMGEDAPRSRKGSRRKKTELVHVLDSPPSQEEVEELLVKRGQDKHHATLFLAHYGANGWMQNNGKPVYSWPHALAGWVERNPRFAAPHRGDGPPPAERRAQVRPFVIPGATP